MDTYRGIAGKKRRVRLGWEQVGWIALGTLACILGAVGFDLVLFANDDPYVQARVFFSAIVLPILLAVPLLTFLVMKISELEILNSVLVEMAETDSMTGLLNRSKFAEVASLQLREAAGSEVALLVIDTDHFKQINDLYGHHAGDTALISVAHCIFREVGGIGLVGRLGGEEFGVALAEINLVDAWDTADRIRVAIADIDFRPGGNRHEITVSIGVTVARDVADFGAVFRDADARLYEAKACGRNMIKIGSHGEQSMATSSDLTDVLQKARDRDDAGAPVPVPKARIH